MVGIFVNLSKEKSVESASAFMQRLDEAGIRYEIINTFDGGSFSTHFNEPEMVIVFGGDGTILSAFKALKGVNAPILGVNTGRLGFLAEATPDDADRIVQLIKEKNYRIDERYILKAETDSDTYFAVNDIAVTRGNSTHTIKITVNIDGEFTDSMLGDGMLVSTPTGSTAYALSCGGPILSPELDVMSIVAICPHTLHSRPMVIDSDSVVELETENGGEAVTMSVDSERVVLSGDKVKVKITRAADTIKFVRFKQENFYKKLLMKLNCWNGEK